MAGTGTKHSKGRSRFLPFSLNLFNQSRFLLSLLIAGLIAGLGSCGPLPPSAPRYSGWLYAQVRLLDPVDSSSPGSDLIAVYTRQTTREIQLRFDWLDLPVIADSDLYIALDTGPGGASSLPIHATSQVGWDLLLVIPATGRLLALDAQLQPLPQPGLWSLRNPEEDSLVVGFRRAGRQLSAGNFRLEAFVTQPGSSQVEDKLGPIHSDDPPPPSAQVLMAFWDTLPAYTPAQALRRWDGAHTGPWGGRHGLYNLLRSARNAGVPLALLDLKSPASLAALDFVGGLPLVRSLSSRGLLILPEPLLGAPGLPSPPAWAAERALEETSQVARRFGLPPSPFQFIATPAEAGLVSVSPAPLVFLLETASAAGLAIQAAPPVGPSRWQNRSVLSISPTSFEPEQVNLNGPVLSIRRRLVAAAIARQEDPGSILILGGDLPASTWGNPQAARAAFRYLAAHPWVRFLNAHDLQVIQPESSFPEGSQVFAPSPPQAAEEPSVALQPFSPDPVAGAAWDTFRSLYAPVYPAPPHLAALRARYQALLQALLLAPPDWKRIATGGECHPDSLIPGGSCWLKSENFLAFFDLHSGALIYLFARSADGWHQIIAPSSQFITGTSDASTWHLEGGLSADPAVIPGALATGDGPYHPGIVGATLILTSADGQVEKRFTLNGKQVRVEVISPKSVETQIPLALLPDARFIPGWSERYQASPPTSGGGLPGSTQNLTWQIEPGVEVQVQASAQLSQAAFTASRSFLGEPEDPNREFPPGHYVPFPLSVIRLTAAGSFTVTIEIR